MTNAVDGVQDRDTKLERRRWFALWAGLGFSAAFFACIVLGTEPDIHESAADTLTYYSDGHNKLKALVVWGLAVLAVGMLVWFLTELTRHLRVAGNGAGSLQAVTIASSLLVATITVASAVHAAPVGDLVMDNEQRAGTSGKLTPAFVDFARTASSLYDWLAFFGIGLASAVLVVSVSLAARSSRALPRWLEWAGYAVAPFLAFVAFFNLVVLMVWIITAGVVIGRAHSGRRADASTPSPTG